MFLHTLRALAAQAVAGFALPATSHFRPATPAKRRRAKPDLVRAQRGDKLAKLAVKGRLGMGKPQ